MTDEPRPIETAGVALTLEALELTERLAARTLGERLLRLGEPILAYDAVTEALKLGPECGKDQRLRQLQALALARVGDTLTANAILEELAREPQDDPKREHAGACQGTRGPRIDTVPG